MIGSFKATAGRLSLEYTLRIGGLELLIFVGISVLKEILDIFSQL